MPQDFRSRLRGRTCRILSSALVIVGSTLFGGCLARAEGDPWDQFKKQADQGEDPRFVVSKSRRADYYHPRDVSVDRFTALVDGFVDFLNAELIPIAPDHRFQILVSADRAEHEKSAELLFSDKRDKSKAIGTYYPKYDVIAVPGYTGPGTITSLLIYPLMHKYIPRAPRWTKTAIATFFEKVFAFPDADGRLVFRVGYHNPWRIEELGACLDRLDLRQIVSNPDYAAGQSHFRLVGTFLWQQGKLKRLIQLLHEQDRRGHANYLMAAFDGKSWGEVRSLWQDYLAETDGNWYGIKKIPLSQIFTSREDFEAAMAATSAQASWKEWFIWRVMLRYPKPYCPIKEQSK